MIVLRSWTRRTQEVGIRADEFNAAIFPLDSNDGVARSSGLGYGGDFIEMFQNLGLEGHGHAMVR